MLQFNVINNNTYTTLLIWMLTETAYKKWTV